MLTHFCNWMFSKLGLSDNSQSDSADIENNDMYSSESNNVTTDAHSSELQSVCNTQDLKEPAKSSVSNLQKYPKRVNRRNRKSHMSDAELMGFARECNAYVVKQERMEKQLEEQSATHSEIVQTSPKIAFFRSGMLYDVYPRNNAISLYDDRQTAYDATIIVSDGKEYDISTIEGINALEVPKFSSTWDAVFEMSYVLKLHCGTVNDEKLIPAMVDKVLLLMQASKLLWRENDFLQVIHNYHKHGLIQEGNSIEKKYRIEHPEMFEDRDYYLSQAAQRSALQIADELGYDAIEITAHLHSSPEHEPIQGKVFMRKEFEKMQAGLPFVDVDGNHYNAIKYPIGAKGCMHMAIGFSTQGSVRKYKDEQLKQWAEDNKNGCEIDGKHYTTWEASQLMRQIEADVREQKEIAIQAMQSGDENIRRECQIKINDMAREYQKVVAASGLTSRTERMSVYGFKMVKV